MFVTTLSARQAAPAAPAAPTYDVVFEVQGQQYVGATTFAVDKAGKVTGTMKLTDPALVNAKLNGEVANGVWKFAYPFTMDNQGQACEGTVAGTAGIGAGVASSSARLDALGAPPELHGAARPSRDCGGGTARSSPLARQGPRRLPLLRAAHRHRPGQRRRSLQGPLQS